MIPLAHEKWFVDDPGRFPSDWGFFFSARSVGLAVAAVGAAVLWRVVARRLPVPELRVLEPLGRFAPWVPRLLAIHLGVALLSLAVTRSYLTPNLELEGVAGGGAIALLEGFVGVWLVSGVGVRPAAGAVVALGPLALGLAGPVAVLEAADILGLALFLLVLPPGQHYYGAAGSEPARVQRAVWLLKVCVGAALVVVAFSEKFANPDLAREFLEDFPAFDLFRATGFELGAGAFIAFAAAMEMMFGLLLISGAAPQAVALVVGVPFNLTLFFLGRDELIGHLPIYGAMLALLVYGSNAVLAPRISSLVPVGGKGKDR